VPGASGSYPQGFTPFGGAVYFNATDTAHGQELFRTDGTAAGTGLFDDLNPGSTGSDPSGFAASATQMMFSATDYGAAGLEPWRTDGTVAGTYRVADVHPGKLGSSPNQFTPAGSVFYFVANDGTHGTEVWTSDGTAAGTSLVADINPGAADGTPEWLTVWGGDLYFQADDDVHGDELWRCGLLPSGGDAGASDGGSGACPGTAPPAMVKVGAYCIDATEVTSAQYGAFLSAVGTNTSGQPPYCGFNTSYQPSTTNACVGYSFDPVGHADYPVACVDWCDADAYCRWAGKHLCGSTQGGSGSFNDVGDPGLDQWMNACSAGGTLAYPYGNTYVAGTCVDDTYGDASQSLQPVLAATGCQGGFPGIYGMSGNAIEWEDACTGTAGGSDTCPLRGGDATGSSTSLACTAYGYNSRSFAYATFGFRCCGEVK
jgi:ELWxxDGT repeat protein